MNTFAERLTASHERLLAQLDGTFDGALIRIAKMTAECPPAPTLHARINDAGLESVDCTGVITGNADLECLRGEPNPNPESPPQCYPLQSSESWTERSL